MSPNLEVSFIKENERSNEPASAEGKKIKQEKELFLIFHSVAIPSAIQPHEQDAQRSCLGLRPHRGFFTVTSSRTWK
jgi:hypothetical protein